jgi:excisionase family DNA binding protein
VGLSKSMVYLLMERGELAYVKLGKSRRIPAKALVELAARHLVVRSVP